MKVLLSLLLSAFIITSTAQSIRFEVPWMDYENFFEPKDIELKSIASITFFQKVKKDGKPMGRKRKVLKYIFNKNGFLTQSIKYASNMQRLDSNFFQYDYNEMNQLIRKDEHMGNFHFSYRFTYMNGKKNKMVKIDMRQNPQDTTLIRYYEHLNAPDYDLEVVKNELEIAFQKNRKIFDEKGRLIKQRNSYLRNAQFNEQRFIYEGKLLLQIDFNSSYTTYKSQKWLFSYKQNELDLIRCFRMDKLHLKYALLYNENGFLENIIERSVIDHTVTVFDLEISQFNQN